MLSFLIFMICWQVISTVPRTPSCLCSLFLLLYLHYRSNFYFILTFLRIFFILHSFFLLYSVIFNIYSCITYYQLFFASPYFHYFAFFGYISMHFNILKILPYSCKFPVSCFLCFRVCSTVSFLSIFYDFIILFLITFYCYKAIHTCCRKLENKTKQYHKITSWPLYITTIKIQCLSFRYFHPYINTHIQNIFPVIWNMKVLVNNSRLACSYSAFSTLLWPGWWYILKPES